MKRNKNYFGIQSFLFSINLSSTFFITNKKTILKLIIAYFHFTSLNLLPVRTQISTIIIVRHVGFNTGTNPRI